MGLVWFIGWKHGLGSFVALNRFFQPWALHPCLLPPVSRLSHWRKASKLPPVYGSRIELLCSAAMPELGNPGLAR